MSGWMQTGNDDHRHVFPVGDLIEHEQNEDCICMPSIELVNEGWLITHHSLDGRELAEADHA